MNDEIKKAMVGLVRLCKQEGTISSSQLIKLGGEELYVSFEWRKLKPKCEKCGRRLE